MTANAGLGRYILTAADINLLDKLGFRPIANDVDLNAVDLKLPSISALKDQKCVYFWRMRHAGQEYKVYVGKTTSLPRGLREYRNKFQPEVPNDFKLRHFQSWAQDKFPGSALDLYATQCADNQAVETEIWRKTKPLINERSQTPSHNLKNSHAEYYWTIFDQKLTAKVNESSRDTLGKHLSEEPNSLRRMRPTRDSIHEMIKKAMRPHAGKILETKEISKIIVSMYPNFKNGNCLPNDHAAGNKSCCPCAKTESRIFDRIDRGLFHVR